MKTEFITADTLHVTSIMFDIEELNENATEFFKQMYNDLKAAFIVEPNKLKAFRHNLTIPCLVNGVYKEEVDPFNKTQAVYTSMLAMYLDYDDEGNNDPAIMYKNAYSDDLVILMSDRCFKKFSGLDA